MTTGIKTTVEHIEGALEAADMAWWTLEFPSGALKFSKMKTDLIGYTTKQERDAFVHYIHFTDLIHPDDYEDTMQAMRDHYQGQNDFYETQYRIQHKDGHYVTFHDKGKIVERSDNGFIVAGVVRKVDE
jgi:two-component system CheB/CheR fusion protein